MNGQESGLPPIDPTALPAPTPYKDRSTGLMVFGILTILLGCVAGLLSLLMVAAISMAPANPQVNTAMILPAVSIYVILAVALVWLGIGSIMARRWARALLLIFSWGWLGIGVISLVTMLFVLPRTFRHMGQSGASGHPLPPGAESVVMLFVLLVEAVIFVVLPAIWVSFYRKADVKATCDARDPKTRWTDACPLPVLGMSLWLLVSAPAMVLMPVSGHAFLPFFGVILTGAPGATGCLAMAAIWSYAAWAVYRLRMDGWWIAMIAFCAFMVSSLITFSRHDFMDVYRLMNYSQAQLDQIEQTGLISGNRMGWLMSLWALPLLGYLLFIKRFFNRA